MDSLIKSVKFVLGKFLTAIVFLFHPTIDSQRRYFLRFYYLGHLNQLIYIYHDQIIKKPYKVIRFYGEFQQELLYVIPFAYWHFKNGTLKKTISSTHTRELYFFSPDHHEEFSHRRWIGNFSLDIPHAPHNHRLCTFRWMQVPFKQYFKNNTFIYSKPILIIANRYNAEWGKMPISFLSKEMLQYIFEKLSCRFQIIYNRPEKENIVGDNSDILEMNEKDWIKTKYPDILLAEDLYVSRSEEYNNYNHFQLMLYANTERFISVHGGTSVLASYFGGINIIYSKKGHEHELNEFNRIFPKIAGTQIVPCMNEEQLKQSILKLI